MKGVKEFLESSTIHGLVYISTSKTTLVKALWTVIVISGFLAASKLIYDSFLDWAEAPVGTSEETFSVEKMSFPKLTVCPPNGTHTALNYDLQKLANKTLKHSLRKELFEEAKLLVEERESWEIMAENRAYKEENRFRNWYNGISRVSLQYTTLDISESLYTTLQNSLNGLYDPNYAYIKRYTTYTQALEGSFQTPWFRQSFDEDVFIRATECFYGLSISDELQDDDEIVINIEVDTKEIDGGLEEINIGTNQQVKPFKKFILTGPQPKETLRYKVGTIRQQEDTTPPEEQNINIDDLTSQLPNKFIRKRFASLPSLPSIPNDKIFIDGLFKTLGMVESYMRDILGIKESEENLDWGYAVKKPSLKIVLFRIIDPLSLYIWKNKRMTGFNFTWHYENKEGKKIKTVEANTFEKTNELYIQWIDALKDRNSTEVWKLIKKERPKYVSEYKERLKQNDKEEPSTIVFGIDIYAGWRAIYKTYEKYTDFWGNFPPDMVKKMLTDITSKVSEISKDADSKLSDEKLETYSEMFFYFFSRPRIEKESLIAVWQKFYSDLFLSKIGSDFKHSLNIILQSLINNIKLELKSRKNKESLSEKLLHKLSKKFDFDYGKFDLLMSKSSDLLNRRDRVQFASVESELNHLLESDDFMNTEVSIPGK